MNSRALFDAERHFAKRLLEHGVKVFEGDTTREARRERFRSAVVNHGLDMAIVGRAPDGKCETYAQIFERIFDQPLIAKQPRGQST